MPTSGLGRQVGKDGAFESPEQEAYLNLIRTASELSGPWHTLFRRHDLTEASYNTLRILRGHHRRGETGGVRAARIGAELVVRGPDVTRLVDRLEGMGLVERCVCPDDKRGVFVRITRAGLRVLDRLDAPVRELHERWLGHMPRRDLAELIRLLEAARAPIERARDNP